MSTLTQSLADAFDEVCRLDAPLEARLAAYEGKLRELNYPFAEAYDALVARVRAGGVGLSAPGPGEAMPPFLLPSHAGELVSLEALVETGPLVISFNRGHWCPFCRIELLSIAGQHLAIRALGAQAVSIMPDTQRFTKPLAMRLASLAILCDVDNAYAFSLGLVMAIGDKVRALLAGRGHHLAEYQGNEGFCVPLPATFVVGRDGVVLARRVDPDFRTRMDPAEILDALRKARA